jgi:hypothetical protein
MTPTHLGERAFVTTGVIRKLLTRIDALALTLDWPKAGLDRPRTMRPTVDCIAFTVRSMASNRWQPVMGFTGPW